MSITIVAYDETGNDLLRDTVDGVPSVGDLLTVVRYPDDNLLGGDPTLTQATWKVVARHWEYQIPTRRSAPQTPWRPVQTLCYLKSKTGV